jgi:hypothetical protein
MSIFSRIGNIIGNSPAASPTSEAAPSAPATGPTSPSSDVPGFIAEGSRLPFAPATHLDSFNEIFGAPPFLTGRWRNGVLHIASRPEVPDEIFQAVLNHVGGLKELFPDATMEKLTEINTRYETLQKQLSNHSFAEVARKFISQGRAQDESLLAGNTPPPIVSKAELENSNAATRTRIHQLIRNLFSEVHALYLPACLKLRDHAREITLEIQAEEKQRAAVYGVEFEPSKVLRTFAYFAVVVAMSPIAGYDGSSFLSPRLDVQNLWSGHVSRPKAQAEAYHQEFQLEARRTQQLQQSTSDHAAELRHRLAIEAINKQNDEIRNQQPKPL